MTGLTQTTASGYPTIMHEEPLWILICHAITVDSV